MEDMIFDFFNQYGWKLTLIACSGILILGILKCFPIFNNIAKSKRKYIYAGISSGLSIIASAIYLICTNGFKWGSFAVAALAIYALNQFAYSIYETTGLRALLRTIGSAIYKIFAHKTIDDSDVVTEETDVDNQEQDPNHIPLD